MTLAALNDGGQLFWVTSRAAGVVALLAASGSVALGASQGAGWIQGRFKRDLRPLHEALSIATMIAIVIHGLALLGDRFIGYSVTEIAIPFTSNYQPFWTGIGVLAGWALIALGLSYYARRSIGPARWRTIHRTTGIFWLLAVAHGLVMGTDHGKVWFLAAVGAIALPAAFALLARWSERLDEPPAAPARRPARLPVVRPETGAAELGTRRPAPDRYRPAPDRYQPVPDRYT